MPNVTLTAIAKARTALQAAEDALSNAVARDGDRDAARKALDRARAELDQARRQAFGSDSGFGLVDPDYPLLLLPVRLETRYASNPHRLLVRIYPDDIHADGHERALTREERELQKTYLLAIEAGHDHPDWMAAWRELARRVGPLRALWLATGSSNVLRPSGWTRAATARLLPERFVAFAWTIPGNAPIRALAPQPVREPLALGPDPMRDDADPDQPLGGDARWLHDFKAALDAGMALEVPLPSGERVTRLIALGVRTSADPAAQAAEFARLIDAHRCTSGVSLLGPGEPTNALGEQRTAYRAHPDADQLYRDELAYFETGGHAYRRRASWEPGGPPRRFDGDEAAGFRLDRALGLEPGTLGRMGGSDDDYASHERLLCSLMASVAADGMERMLAPSVAPEAIGFALESMHLHVSAGGPFATLRIGQQPYGVLPVRLADRRLLDTEQTALLDLLDRLRTVVFEPALDEVLRVSAPRRNDPVMNNPGRRLLEILRFDAHARGLGIRAVLDPALLSALLPGMNPVDRRAIGVVRNQIRGLLAALGDPSPQATAIGQAGLFDDVAPVTLAMVGDAAAVAQLAALRRPEFSNPHPVLPIPLMTLELLDGIGGPPRPYTLLFELARQAVLRTADRAARQWLRQDALDNGRPVPDFDNPLAPFGTMESRLRAPAPSDPTNTIAFLLDNGVFNVPAGTEFWTLRKDLGQLAALPPARIETALGAVAGLLTHRLDAWYTGFAIKRLNELRTDGATSTGNAPPMKPGLAVGAFGWLDAYPAGSGSSVAGYVHAPSTQHAMTAAVLLSADKAHRVQGHGNAFAVDLSSTRVRGALDLLEGLRAGQPLGALLGYRIERGLAATAPALIARVRAAAPLVANKREPSGLPAESVAADNVVDGLALLRLAAYDGTNLPDSARLTALDAAGQAAIAPILADAADRIDALADLLLAEAVHHTLAGTPMRAGAAGDLLAGGPVGVPDEIEVARIGQRGIATTHKVLALFEPEARIASRWSLTPRAGAEPGLDAWLAEQLPDPSSIAITATFLSADDAIMPVTTTLGSLLAVAGTQHGLGATDLVLLKPPVLERRLQALLEAMRPGGSVGAPTLQPEAKRQGRPGDWSLAEVAVLAATLHRLLGGARGLVPADIDALGQAAGAALDTNDLEKRLSSLRDAAVTARDALAAAGDDTARLAAMASAELFGLDAVPSAGPLEAAAASVRRELDRRITEAGDASRPLVDRMRSIGGTELVVVPRLTVNGATLDTAFTASIGATPSELRAFLARAAGVREPVARLDAVLADAESLAGASAPYHTLAVAQHPMAPGDRWTALPGPTAPSRTSYVVARSAALDLAHATHVAGLFIDGWTEVVPQSEVDTAIVFDAPAASQAAPNAMLLLVPEASRERWTEDDVLAHVLEALSLAKLRSVDPDLVARAGALLPALLLRDGDGTDSLADLWTTPVAP
jgi:hypothetical protein